MKANQINKLFEGLVNSLGMDINEVERNFKHLTSKEVSNSQINRVLQISQYLSQAKGQREYKLEVVISILDRFMEVTEGMNKDQIKCAYRSFMTIPRFNNNSDVAAFMKSATYKNLTTEEKDRDAWGKPHKMCEYFDGDSHLQDQYIKLLLRIKRDLKKSKRK